jgi:hypothetical protein
MTTRFGKVIGVSHMDDERAETDPLLPPDAPTRSMPSTDRKGGGSLPSAWLRRVARWWRGDDKRHDHRRPSSFWGDEE